MRKAIVFIASVFLLMLSATPVYAAGVPPLPHAFYGDVTINGNPAPIGTTVEARGSGVLTGIEGNPITTTERGKYGSSNPLEPRLIVQGDISDETTIRFYVNGHYTDETYPFDSGETTPLTLSVTITEPPPPPPPTIETNLFGIERSFPISDEGVIEEEIVATSEDEYVTMTIEAGTIALDIEGEPLETLTTAVDPSPPEPPEDTYLIAAYDFGPDGATFDPPITLTWSYDPETLPEDVDLVIAYYDEVNEEWVWVPCEVDTENNIITASVAHFTTFAIIGTVRPPEEEEVVPPEEEEVVLPPAAFSVSHLSISRLEVEPGEAVTIAVLVANTGGESGSYTVVLKINGVKEAEETVTIAAGESLDVSFSVTREDHGNYTLDVDGLSGSFTVVLPVRPPGVNWPLIGGIIGGVIVVVGLLYYFLVFRRRAY